MKVVPSLRYYSQSQAFFYEPYYGTARADLRAALASTLGDPTLSRGDAVARGASR